MKKGIYILFLALVAILIVSPTMLYNIYDNMFGKIALLGLIVYFAQHNVTLGLLGVLCLIIALNSSSSFIEGMETQGTVGEDNVPPPTGTNIQKVITKEQAKQKLSELKQKAAEAGIDINDIKDAIASKASNSIPIDKNAMNSSENVEAFSPNMLNGSSIEGFCGACAAAQM